MIRLLLGFAVPAVTVALAAVSLIGKGVLTEPRGAPMLVAEAEPFGLQPAAFDGSDCAGLVFAEIAEGAGPHLGVLALAGMAVAVQEIPAGASGTGASLYLAVDAEGHILAIGDTPDFGLSPAAAAEDCTRPQPIPGNV
jgi:hypothetical protein